MKITMPCLNVQLVAREKVVANTYNPNNVSDEKLELLRTSIIENGFCFPIVTIFDPGANNYVIIDGFHRFLLCSRERLNIKKVPIIVLDHDITKRMAATVQFNKARGSHQVDLDAEIVRALIEQGVSEEDIGRQLGMDLDAVHRYKQITGFAELFKNAQYSLAWEMASDGSNSQ